MTIIRKRLLVTICLLGLALSGCRAGRQNTEPSVEFTDIPEAGPGGPALVMKISGRVKGTGRTQKIVLFAKSGTWWVQPFSAKPFTEIRPDSTWEGTTHMGTEYAALLVDAEYQPPKTSDVLPGKGSGVVAVAKIEGKASAK